MPVALLTALALSAIALAAVTQTSKSTTSRCTTVEQTRAASQAEERFIYEVLDRVLARTVDSNRYVDMLLLGVLAADVAVFVLVVEKATSYHGLSAVITVLAAGISSAGLLMSCFVREYRIVKQLIFIFALILLFAAALATSAGTMIESSTRHEAHQTHSPDRLPPPASGNVRS